MKPNRLKFLREDRKLTQEEVSKIIGIDFTTISKHENMDRNISSQDLEKYAKLYKVSTHEIFFLIPENEEEEINEITGQGE